MGFVETVAAGESFELATTEQIDSPGGMKFVVGVNASFEAIDAGYYTWDWNLWQLVWVPDPEPYSYDVSGSTGAIDILVRQSGEFNVDLEASKRADSLKVNVQNDGYADLDLSASRIGATALTLGTQAEADLYLSAEQGPIGPISMVLNGASASAYVSAYASAGSIGNINVRLNAQGGVVDVSAGAVGGNIGNTTFVTRAANGSGDIDLYASATLNSLGAAVGGNIGNIVLDNEGDSGYYYIYADTAGAVDGGVYKGGGNIGDITLINRAGGGSTSMDAYLNAYSGGSIGDIFARSNPGTNGYSASVDVSAYVEGVGSHVARIGNVDIAIAGQNSHTSSAYVDLEATSGGNIGNIAVRVAGAGANSGYLDVYASADTGTTGAGGRIGNINLSNSTANGDTNAYIDAMRGMGNVNLAVTGASGSLYADLDAGSGGPGRGGIGNIQLVVGGAYSYGQVDAMASGGNIGNVTVLHRGQEGSAGAYVSAYGELNEAGNAAGGNIGDIRIITRDFWGSAQVDAYAYGVVSGGVYQGGGNIGNITLINTASEGVASGYFRSYSGGSIGTITVRNNPGLTGYSGSAHVDASVEGVGDHVAKIGNISVVMGGAGGADNSAYVQVDAYSGGQIGNISMVYAASNTLSGIFDLEASAYANAAGTRGGRIGNITILNTSWAGDNEIDLWADRLIGDISVAQTGGGSAGVDISIGGAADVGNVTIGFGAKVIGSAGSLYIDLVDGLDKGTVGDITITGGSRFASYSVIAEDAGSIGNVDMSTFRGSSYIDLGGIEGGERLDMTGTVIRASQKGSSIDGTQGADRIVLGAGQDTVEVVGNTSVDDIRGFKAAGDATTADKLDVFGVGFFEGFFTTNVGEVADSGDVFVFTDIAGGQDITNEAGLFAALNAGGEYASFTAAANARATFVTAATAGATKFYVFEAHNTDGDAGFDSVNLVAVVNSLNAFSTLDADNFL